MPDDLYRLLGLAPETDIERLRAAYEGAVAAASQRLDWARARTLSAAFDRLPARVRLAVYPGRERIAHRWQPVVQPGSETRRRRRRPARQTVARGSAPRRSLWRDVLSVVAVGVILVTAGASYVDRRPDVAGQTLPRTAVAASWAVIPPPPKPRPSLVPYGGMTPLRTLPGGVGNTGQQIGGLPLWIAPPNAPLDANGDATARCVNQSGAASPAFKVPVDPSQAFTCGIGALPVFVTP